MYISVILAHPAKGSFNHAIAEAAVLAAEQNGHRVIFHDLYAEGFDPLLTAAEIARDAELPPAILKGWVDRVIRPEVAYRFDEGDSGEGIPIGLLKAGIALVFNTSNTSEQREREVFGDPLEELYLRFLRSTGLSAPDVFSRGDQHRSTAPGLAGRGSGLSAPLFPRAVRPQKVSS